jgi:exodeoxyribonuclease-5
VPATTLHRLLYRPVFHPAYEELVDWLSGARSEPPEGILDAAMRERARAFAERHGSIVGALAVAGLSGSDFIAGWKRRDEPLDIGLVDEASMLHADQLDDLKALFPSLVLFGDPAQLGPVKGTGMVFDTLPAPAVARLTTVHRQAAGNPIIRLAHALAEPDLSFAAFEDEVRREAEGDPRVEVAPSMDADLMARSPALVWRNATRLRLIAAFRQAFEAPADALVPGEPLVCDGIELPAKHANRRIELEARGLIRGAQAVFLRAGRQRGFVRVHMVGAEEPVVTCAAIVRIESAEEAAEPWLPFAARMGATFVHGAALTIHKAQGSQWPVVQVFAPDLWTAARTGREDAGLPLWKRLAYVALTRAQERLRWVVRPRLARPSAPLSADDLA